MLRLTDHAASAKLKPSLRFFLDVSGLLTAADADWLAAKQFVPVTDVALNLNGGTLWQRIDVVLDQVSRPWHLSAPLPGVLTV